MPITSIKFKDNIHKWDIEETNLSEGLNLLVGLSGVGKTRVLDTLKAISSFGKGREAGLHGCEWTVKFKVGENIYEWFVKKSNDSPNFMRTKEGQGLLIKSHPAKIVKENLLLNGKTIIRRDADDFFFNEEALPKLKHIESAISLLSDEEVIFPLFQSLQLVTKTRAVSIDGNNTFEIIDSDSDLKHENIDDLRDDDLSFISKAYCLYKQFPEEFEKVKNDYIDIFPNVVDVKVCSIESLGEQLNFAVPPEFKSAIKTLAIRENGVADWILPIGMSSGMKRTLFHLIELAVIPSKSVILIDEYENNLGVNCLPALTRHIRERSIDIQFILTSHHPYVINNIPAKDWKIVTRKGSTIKITNASQCEGITSSSSQAAFTQLMNSEAMEDGIQ